MKVQAKWLVCLHLLRLPMERNGSCWASAGHAYRVLTQQIFFFMPASVFLLGSPMIGYLPAEHCLVSLKASFGSDGGPLDQKWTLKGNE